MELLRIKHEDFTLTVESTQFQNIKAKGDDDDNLHHIRLTILTPDIL